MTAVLTGGILRVVRSPVIAFDAPGLENGIRFGYVHAGAMIYDVGVFIPVAFDGTTPLADISLYQGGDTTGLWQQLTAAPIDLTQVDIADNPAHGLTEMGQFPLSTLTSNGVGVYAKARVTTAGPLYVVASQDGTKGGAAVGGAAGELVAWCIVAG